MGGQDWLRTTHVRVRGHERIPRALRLIEQHADQRHDRPLQGGNLALQIQAQVDGNLLVAGPTGVQPASSVADPLDQLALDEGVHIFILGSRRRLEE